MPKDFSHERSITVISTILFGVTSYWSISKIVRDRHRKANSGQAFRPDYVDLGENEGLHDAQIVSPRCRNAMSPATPYLMSFLRGLEYTCTPESVCAWPCMEHDGVSVAQLKCAGGNMLHCLLRLKMLLYIAHAAR